MKSVFIITVLLLFSLIFFAQKDKTVFIKEVPIQLKSTSSYTSYVRYEFARNCDIVIDFYGGANNFWVEKIIPVKKEKDGQAKIFLINT